MTDLNQTNANGVPLHACAGYRQDEHYWDWLKARRLAWAAANPGKDYAAYIASGGKESAP